MEATSIETIRRALAPIREVRVAYVFGSQLGATAHPESDLDLAVAFDASLDAAEKDRIRLEIVARLTDALGPLGERTDIVDLEEADSAVAFTSIQGECVLSREDLERQMLEVRIARRYDDDAKVRRLYRFAARKRWGAS